jgi:hypothetical protein
MKRILLIALLLTVPLLADDSDMVKAAKKKPGRGVITNETVKKNATPSSGSKTGAPGTVPAPPKSPAVIEAEQKIARDDADAHLKLEEAAVAQLERDIAALELSYYAESDPDFRDRVITARFLAMQEKLAAARKELAQAREASAKLQLKNVIVVDTKKDE